MQQKTKVNKKVIIAIAVAAILLIGIIVAVVILVGRGDEDSKGNNEKATTTAVQNSTIDGSRTVAATYGDITITQEEYSYGYMSLYNQVLSVVKQYDEYYPGYGSQYYDVTLSPADQPCPADSLPEGVETWGDYFTHYATERAVLIKTLYTRAMSEEAKKAGFKITDEQKAEMDNNVKVFIDALKVKAEKEGQSIDEYISGTYGYSLSQKVYEEQLKREYISELYLLWYSTHLSETVSQEDIDTYYMQNRVDLDIVTVRAYTFSYASSSQDGTPTYSKDEAKSKADKFLSEVSGEQSFIDAAVKYAPESMKTAYADYSATLMPNYTKTQISSLSNEMAEWLFDDARKLNDKTVVDLSEHQVYMVVMVTELPHKDMSCTSADVRHLLIEYGDDKDAAKKKAQELLDNWKRDDGTEDGFIELVKLHTDDVASAETGGLYEDINSTSSYVPEFLAWAIAPHKYADAGIVETTYGYHIMFYVDGDATPKWEHDVRLALAQMEYSNFYDDLYDDITENTKKEQKVIDKVNVENLNMIVKYQGLLEDESDK